jgi:hypothetical protein
MSGNRTSTASTKRACLCQRAALPASNVLSVVSASLDVSDKGLVFWGSNEVK